MNREILFRGKAKEIGEWIYGLLVESSRNGETKYFIQSAKLDRCVYEVHEDTIGQFTGAKDSSGSLIFEGDIVTAELFSGDDCKEYAISFSSFYYGFRGIDRSGENDASLCDITYQCAVIGNIYDDGFDEQ